MDIQTMYVDHCSKMFNHSFYSDINRIGSNICTAIPDYDRTGLHNDNIRLDYVGLQKSPIRSTLVARV